MTLTTVAETAKAELFPLYRDLDRLWDRLEEQINTLHIPDQVWHQYRRRADNDAGCYVEYYLILGRGKDRKWAIKHAVMYEAWPEDTEPQDIKACSIVTKVECVEHVPAFLEAISESLGDFKGKVNTAIGKMRAICPVDASGLF